MMPSISASLDAISAGLDQLSRATAVRLLRSGLDAHALAAELAVCGLRSPADLAAIYAWHDGIDATSAPHSASST